MPRTLPIPLPLISYATIMQEDLPPVEWIVGGLIAQGDRVVLYGEFGSMKSWLLLDMGLHIAAGVRWLDQFDVPQAKRVLYVDEEMSRRTLRRRIHRLGTGMNIQTEHPPFMAMSQVGVRFNEDGAASLLSALRESNFDPEIIIVETLRRVMVGSENESVDVSAFWRNLEPLRRSGKTVIISHHMRKPSAQGRDDNRNRASGSTDILAGSDTNFAIERPQGGNSIFIEHVKCREGEEALPFFVAFQSPDGQNGPVSLCFECFQGTGQPSRTRLQHAQQLAEAYLSLQPEHTARTADIQAHLRAVGIAERTGTRALRTHPRIISRTHGLWTLVEEPVHAV